MAERPQPIDPGLGEPVDFEGALVRLQGLIGEHVAVQLISGRRGAATSKVSVEGHLTSARDLVEPIASLPAPYRGAITFALEPGGSFTLSPHDFLEAYWSVADPNTQEGDSLLVLLSEASSLHVWGPSPKTPDGEE